MGSPTLFIKILFADYDEGFVVIEMIGEWNDAISNDIMILKRDIAEHFMAFGINKFILIGENVLNFHASDDCYYEEWTEEVREGGSGWIALINFRDHVLSEFNKNGLLLYLNSGDELDDMHWRNLTPLQLFQLTERSVLRQEK